MLYDDFSLRNSKQKPENLCQNIKGTRANQLLSIIAFQPQLETAVAVDFCDPSNIFIKLITVIQPFHTNCLYHYCLVLPKPNQGMYPLSD